MQPIESINEFVIRFANVNGTGSASANGMVAKSFFRLGLPIGPKNMFPSNIQGLPTWYEVRVSARGYTGRRGGVDLMVAMNPQTFRRDVDELLAGGYLLYDSTRKLAGDQWRDDIVYLPLPITNLTRDEFPNAKTRAMLKNMVYVGALSAVLGIDLEVYRQLVREQFSNKPKLHENNFKALQIGYDYAAEHFSDQVALRIDAADKREDRIIIGGNDAAGLGCVYAGATVAAWYPITPSTSLVDSFSNYCHRFRVDEDGNRRFAIIQAEDEIASIGMVLGASWNGARAFTATSGPGISLMSEFIGYAYYAEIPAVLFNVQRCGPSTGMPTRTQQADLTLCAYASHGDTKHVLVFPSTPKECFEMSVCAFDLADRLQTPVFVMSDLELAMNDYDSPEFDWEDGYNHDRGKVLASEDLERLEGAFFRYLDRDGDGITARTYPGVHPKGAYFTRGSGHDEYGRYTEDGAAYQKNIERLQLKFETAASLVPKSEIDLSDDAESAGLICYGTTAEPMIEALDRLRGEGLSLDYCRLRAFPFDEAAEDFCRKHRKVIIVEQNRDAQMLQLLCNEFDLPRENLVPILGYDGMPLTADWIVARVREELNR